MDQRALAYCALFMYGVFGMGATAEALLAGMRWWKGLLLLIAWPGVFCPCFIKWLARGCGTESGNGNKDRR
jgi:hypothetical protein